MIRYGNSGCFVAERPENEETRPAADALPASTAEAGDAAAAIDAMMGLVAGHVRRVRMITWAVVAIAMVVLMREIK